MLSLAISPIRSPSMLKYLWNSCQLICNTYGFIKYVSSLFRLSFVNCPSRRSQKPVDNVYSVRYFNTMLISSYIRICIVRCLIILLLFTICYQIIFVVGKLNFSGLFKILIFFSNSKRVIAYAFSQTKNGFKNNFS